MFSVLIGCHNHYKYEYTCRGVKAFKCKYLLFTSFPPLNFRFQVYIRLFLAVSVYSGYI